LKMQRFTPTRKARTVLVGGMLLLLILLLTGGPAAARGARVLHEWAGLALFAAPILHTVWNRRWYAALFRGPYSAKRTLLTVIDLALAAFFLLIMASSPMVSQVVFSFLHLHGASLGRRLHLLSTAWAFLLMGFHLGLHHGGVHRKAVFLLPAAGGAAAFIHLRLWERLFLLSEFVFVPNIPIIVQWCEYLLILFLLAVLGTETMRCLTKNK
jgi:hypothetical protein